MEIGTGLFSDGEVSDLAVFVSADMENLAGGVESICLVDGSSIPGCLIGKHMDKRRPGGIGDCLRQAMGFQHVFDP